MHVQGREREAVDLYEPVHVDEPQNETFIAAARVLEDAIQVPMENDGDRGERGADICDTTRLLQRLLPPIRRPECRDERPRRPGGLVHTQPHICIRSLNYYINNYAQYPQTRWSHSLCYPDTRGSERVELGNGSRV